MQALARIGRAPLSVVAHPRPSESPCFRQPGARCMIVAYEGGFLVVSRHLRRTRFASSGSGSHHWQLVGLATPMESSPESLVRLLP